MEPPPFYKLNWPPNPVTSFWTKKVVLPHWTCCWWTCWPELTFRPCSLRPGPHCSRAAAPTNDGGHSPSSITLPLSGGLQTKSLSSPNRFCWQNFDQIFKCHTGTQGRLCCTRTKTTLTGGGEEKRKKETLGGVKLQLFGKKKQPAPYMDGGVPLFSLSNQHRSAKVGCDPGAWWDNEVFPKYSALLYPTPSFGSFLVV